MSVSYHGSKGLCLSYHNKAQSLFVAALMFADDSAELRVRHSFEGNHALRSGCVPGFRNRQNFKRTWESAHRWTIVFVVHSSLFRDSSVCLRHPWLLSSFLVARSGIASFCVRREKVILEYIYRKHSNHIRLIISGQIVVEAAFKPWLAFGLQSFCMRTGPYRFSVRTSS